MTVLIFDCDGVLADTERYGHLPAFNRMFEEFGLPVQWSEAEYGRRLAIGGGKERLMSLLDTDFVRAAKLPDDRQLQLREVARWHARKTQIYTETVRDGRLPARPGIHRIISAALEAGWRLAVASTSAQLSVEAILAHVAGPVDARRFAGVFAGDIVERKKPAPDIYLQALERLQATREETLVIEDSRIGLEAAGAAGLACVVTVNGYTADEDFDKAILVVDGLGDPGGPSSRVLADPFAVSPGPFVTVADLARCLDAAAAREVDDALVR